MLVPIYQKTKSGHHILKYSHGMRDMCDLLVFGARGQCKTNKLMLIFRTRDTICGEQKINRPTSALAYFARETPPRHCSSQFLVGCPWFQCPSWVPARFPPCCFSAIASPFSALGQRRPKQFASGVSNPSTVINPA